MSKNDINHTCEIKQRVAITEEHFDLGLWVVVYVDYNSGYSFMLLITVYSVMLISVYSFMLISGYSFILVSGYSFILISGYSFMLIYWLLVYVD